MMICIVSSSAEISGAEIVLKDHIIKSTHEYVLLIPKICEVSEFFSNIPSIKRIYYLPSYMTTSKYRLLSRLQNIIVLIKEAHYIAKLISSSKLDDVTTIYGNNSISCISLGIVEKLYKNKKFILHIHDMMSACSFKYLIKIFCRNITTITVSQKCKDELVRIANFDQRDITVIYNGISENEFNKIELSTSNTHIRIGFAGNIIQRKGLLELARAFEKLNTNNKNVELKITYHLMDEKYFAQVENILKHSLYSVEKNSRQQMNDFYHSIDILVVPSIKDPLPTTVLEAMACGLIVIGSDVDGIPEMLSEKFLFNPNDSESIYNKLNWVISCYDEIRKECFQTNPMIVLEKFHEAQKVKQMDKFLEMYI